MSISISNLTVSYGSENVISGLDLDIAEGSFFTLLGPSGCGKTTLLRTIAGFVGATAGRIAFSGRDVTQLPPHRRDIGMVFQDYALFPDKTVFENVAYGLRARRVREAEIRQKVPAALERVGLGHLAQRRPAALSGGQRQRVALARAIVFEPKVLLMDEPLSALDKTLREEMQMEIRELHNKLQITTLYVTHDQREALTIADRVAVMNKGRIVQLDSPEAIYRRPTDEFVARFIGEATILPLAKARGMVAGDLGTVEPSARALMVRSEDFCLSRAGGDGGWLTVSGLLRGIVFQGDSWLLQVDLADGQAITARAQKHFSAEVGALEVGQTVDLHVRRDRVHLL